MSSDGPRSTTRRRSRGSTEAEVRDALEDELAYTTVLTMLRIMETKGYVSRCREGRADRYAPEVALDQAAREVASVYRFSPALVGNEPVTARVAHAISFYPE